MIFCQHFTPAFKGGGPIQSLQNLIELLRFDFEVYIFCSAKDLGDSKSMDGIIVNQWVDFSQNVRVLYADGPIYQLTKNSLKALTFDIVYINGIFSIPFNLIPLSLALLRKSMIVLTPHGMLQKGALSVKPFKKRIFLFGFKLMRFHRKIHWHATDNQEKDDITNVFGRGLSVNVIATVPKLFSSVLKLRNKTRSSLRLVYLSLITEKKNLHLVLLALRQISTPIEFHIYGPIKDKEYWEECRELLNCSVHLIEYKGIVFPKDVQLILSNYHLFILPTKGENFGHAIYESLSVGTPVMVSPHTPWGRLQDYNAGITVSTLNSEDWAIAIKSFIDLDQEMYSVYSNGAYRLAADYFEKNDFKTQYQFFFNEIATTNLF